MKMFLADLLAELVNEFGERITYDAPLLRGLINDYQPNVDEPWLPHVVLEIAQKGLARQLWNFRNQEMTELSVRIFADELEKTTAMKNENIIMGVHCWAHALKIQILADFKYEFRNKTAIMSFVESLMAERKVTDIGAENIDAIRVELIVKIIDKLNQHLLNLVPDNKREELTNLLENNFTQEKLDTFFRKTIPNLSEEIAAALLQFREIYLFSSTKKAQNFQRSSTMYAIVIPVLIVVGLFFYSGPIPAMVIAIGMAITIGVNVSANSGKFSTSNKQIAESLRQGKEASTPVMLYIVTWISVILMFGGAFLIQSWYGWICALGYFIGIVGYITITNNSKS